jgi:acyl phosphate:glycerol-3-phosphate acyltransferase
MVIIISLIVLAYLLGSIPTSVWVGRWFYNIDIREHGSGNAGATNTIRVLGAKAGIPVFIFDAFKGWAAVSLANCSSYAPDSNQFMNLKIALGVFAVIGHIFPLFAGFKGGKGVATLLGMVIGLTPLIALIAFGIFVIVLMLTKIVSISSMTAGLFYPLFVILIFKIHIPSLIVFSVVAAILLIFTHRKNIGRLLKGEEPKAVFLVKK